MTFSEEAQTKGPILKKQTFICSFAKNDIFLYIVCCILVGEFLVLSFSEKNL
jgi:hypothetical protein